jgi:hypothetical protein
MSNNNNNNNDPPPEDTANPADASTTDSRGWYADNSWILTPIFVFVGIAVLCVGVHMVRSRRHRRRGNRALAAVASREDAYDTPCADAAASTTRGRLWWRPWRKPGHGQDHDDEHGRDLERGPSSASFDPPRGSLVAQIDDGYRLAGGSVAAPPYAHLARRETPRRTHDGARPDESADAEGEGLDEFGEAPPPYEGKRDRRAHHHHHHHRHRHSSSSSSSSPPRSILIETAPGGAGARGRGRDREAVVANSRAVEMARIRAEADAIEGERPPEYDEMVVDAVARPERAAAAGRR